MTRLPARLLILFATLVGTGAALAARPAPAAVVNTFDITVSIEWQPGAADRMAQDLALAGCRGDTLATPGLADPTLIDDLKAGLSEMAAFFYNYTHGQMAIGTVTIYTGGQAWEQADIRVLANRSFRPSAFIGGISATPRVHRPAGTGGDAVVFQRGPILLGRLWDGDGTRCGPWSAPAGWRTLAHEWAHYALFLYDEYIQQASGRSQYCGRDNGLPLIAASRAPASTGGTFQSLMAYHYSADQLSLWDAAGPPPACRGTPQTAQLGGPAWATVPLFYPGLSAPADLGLPFSGPPPTPPGFVVIDPAPAGERSASVNASGLPVTGQVAQVYLIRPGPDGEPLRIIGQGNLLPGEELPLRFLGVDEASNDRAALILDDLAGGRRFSYPADYRPGVDPLRPGSETNSLAATPSSWRPALRIDPLVQIDPVRPELGSLRGLDVSISECSDKPPVAIEVSYCPAGGACRSPVAATPQSDGSFRARILFTPNEEAAPHGYIYAREPFRGAETLTWYQIAGGVGPAHSDGHAPIAEGELVVDRPQNEPAPPMGDNRVLYSPAQVCTTANSLPPGITQLVGPAYAIQATLGDQGVGQPWGQASHAPLRVRLNYDQDLLDRLGVDEARLVVLQLLQGDWVEVPAAGQSAELNWIVAEPQPFAPDGAIYALGAREARLMLPLLFGP